MFDILLEKYPQVLLIGSKFIKGYLITDESISSSVAILPYDAREIKPDINGSSLFHKKLYKLRQAYSKVVS